MRDRLVPPLTRTTVKALKMTEELAATCFWGALTLCI